MGKQAQRRRQKEDASKALGKAMVYLAVPVEFLDVGDEPWSMRYPDNSIKTLDLAGVLMQTARAAPVRTGADAEHALDVFQAIKEHVDGFIALPKADYDWMIAHFREMAHTVWKAPDAAFLVRYIERHVQSRPPGDAVSDVGPAGEDAD